MVVNHCQVSRRIGQFPVHHHMPVGHLMMPDSKWMIRFMPKLMIRKREVFLHKYTHSFEGSLLALKRMILLAPQSGALRISAYRDFLPSHPNPNPIPLIAFEHLSLSMVIRNSASRPRQIK